MKTKKSFLVILYICISTFCFAQKDLKTPQLKLIKQHPEPVITVRSKGAEGIKWGFEGGRVVKIGKQYHLFTSEMVDNPIWTKMKLGYWVSLDGLNWVRKATIKEGSGNFTGIDERAALWSPLPVFNKATKRWHLFYVAYKSAPSLPINFLGNHAGRIWHSVSVKKGINGISGPYVDKGIILKPGPDSGKWEGLQGTDSFFPYKVGKTWYAFYGSAKTETKPVENFLVGMAKSVNGKIGGPWKRIAKLSPAQLENHFIENPIVTPAQGGGFLCVYDCEGNDAIGWAYSIDGINWGKGNRLIIQPKSLQWAKDVRTPLGLINQGKNRFTLFYTGFEETPNWSRLLMGEGKETCAVGQVELVFKP